MALETDHDRLIRLEAHVGGLEARISDLVTEARSLNEKLSSNASKLDKALGLYGGYTKTLLAIITFLVFVCGVMAGYLSHL